MTRLDEFVDGDDAVRVGVQPREDAVHVHLHVGKIDLKRICDESKVITTICEHSMLRLTENTPFGHSMTHGKWRESQQ